MSRTDLLPSAIVRHNELKAELLGRFASLQDDPEALADTVEGVSALPDLLKRIVWEIRRLDRDETAISTRINDLRERKNALQERQQRLRALVAHGMTEGGIDKIDDVEFSVGLSEAKPRLVIDESEVPSCYFRSEVVSVVNKDAIREMIDAGFLINGVHMSNGGTTLTIRPKRARKEAAE